MKKLFSLIFLLTFSLGQSQNMISNSYFTSGSSGWTFSSPGAVSAGEMVFSSTIAGGDPWGTELNYPSLTLTNGQTYTVTFRARSNTNRNIKVQFQTIGGGWGVHYSNPNVALTTAMTVYQYTFVSSGGGSGISLLFHLAATGSTAPVYIDDVTLVTGTPTQCTNFIQDADETGVDCGGSTCGACLTNPTLTTFTVPAKLTTDVDFTFTGTTSNSAGAITYTSSNTAVATITSGTTIHIVGAGTSVITANQVANGSYYAGSTTANFVVTSPYATLAATTAVSELLGTTATSGGNVTAIGSSAVTAKGVCWGTTTEPTVALATKTNDGTGTGAFTSSLTGLTIGTTYYVRAYATNTSGTAYGTEVSFVARTNTECSGNSTVSTDGVAFTQGYDYTFTTSGTTVTATFKLLDTKTGLIAYAWTENPNFAEVGMTAGTNQTFTKTFTDAAFTAGYVFKIRCKFAYAGGMSVTKLFSYTVGNACVITAPVLTSTAATAVDLTTATANGNISSNGGGSITSYGFYTSTTNGFANGAGTQVVVGTTNVTGAISSNLTGLTSATTYYYKAYATNSSGTTYGAQQSFTTTSLPAPTFNAFTIASKIIGDADFDLTAATSNSAGAITYTSGNTAVATISGTTVHIVGVGTSVITASQAATASYSAGTTTASFVVTAPPAPTFNAFTIASKIIGDADFDLTAATSNSAGAITYTSGNTAVATISGTTVHIVGVGTSVITASQAATASYSAGTTTASFIVTFPPAPPTGPTAPPVRNNLNVLSQYGSAYTNQTGVIFDNFGGGATIVGDVTLDDNSVVKKYTNHSYSGISPNSSNNLNVSGMTHLHMDVWSPNFVSFKVKLEATNGSNNEIEVPFTKVQGVWNSYDIPLSTYVNTNLTILKWIVPVTFNPNNTTLFITNVYFYKQDTWSGTTTTNWATTTNWVSGAVPTSTSDVVIPTATRQPIIGSDVTINSLAISTGATLTVNSGYNLTVTNAVANSGTMTLQNNANLLQSSATTTNSNSGNLIVKRNSASLLRLDHTLWSSPVASQNLYNFSPLTLMNRFYTYNTVSNGYVTTGLDATTTFAAGKGYAVRAPNDHSALTPTTWEGTFTGIPNNGTVPFTLDTNGSGFNLVGNPYPSPITATSFLTENSSKIGGTLYFYAHSLPMNADGTFPTGTNYSTWNASATTVATTATSPDPHLAPEVPNGIIQVGQGFFVKATAAGTINFTNTMRVANNANQFFRTTEIERHRLWLNLTTESGDDINQIAVAYVEGATQNADTNFDGLSFGNAGSMLSSKIDGSDYVIQGRSLPFASNDMVPLGFKATAAGNYKIVLTDKDGLFLGNQDVFVRDNLMGIEHNIKVSPYTFASEIGTFDTRFQLVYTQTLGIPSTTFTPNAVIVYKNTDGFHVTTNGIVMKDILVYDISGRLIFKQSNINGTTTVLKGLLQTKQVLLLKITSQENETVTVKAIN